MSNLIKTGSLNDLKKTYGTGTRTVKILDAYGVKVPKANGGEYKALEIEFIYTDAENPVKKTKTRPVRSNEAALLFEKGPFSPDTEYEVTIGRMGKFQYWTDIKPLDNEVLENDAY